MKDLRVVLASLIPFELKRGSSFVSVVVGIIIFGAFAKLGEKILDGIISAIPSSIPYLANLFKFLLSLSITINLNLFTIILFGLIFFPIYRIIDKFLLRGGKNTIFLERFGAPRVGWILNYWGSNNPTKTARFESSNLIFEAQNSDLTDSRHENGAYFDLTNGIYQGNTYEVSCKVRADQGSTMSFQLWVHDVQGQNDVKYPTTLVTPTETYQTLRVRFVATASQGLRVHLHTRAGTGKIYVNEVKVVKL